MTSKPQSTTTPKLPLSLAEAVSTALVSHEYDDIAGVVNINVVDSLLAIAAAINRLAQSQEVLAAVQDKAIKQADQRNDMIARMIVNSDRPGHA